MGTIARCRNDDPETTKWTKEDAPSELKRICARTKRKHRYRNGLHVRQCTEHHGCEFLIRVHQEDDIEWVVQACSASSKLLPFVPLFEHSQWRTDGCCSR